MVAACTAWASQAAVLAEPIRKVARALVSPRPLSPLAGWSLVRPLPMRWSPYDRVGVVHVDR
jgi:hypothetical protein